MTSAQSKSEVNHCYTRFEKVIDRLKGCKIDRINFDKSEVLRLACKNGVYLTKTDLTVQTVVVTTAVDSIFIWFKSTKPGNECIQETYDEFGIQEKFETLHYSKEDNKQIYKYVKTKLLRK